MSGVRLMVVTQVGADGLKTKNLVNVIWTGEAEALYSIESFRSWSKNTICSSVVFTEPANAIP